MVTYYIASAIYNQIISQTIQESGFMVDGSEIGENVYLLNFVKKNFNRFSSIDELVIDLSALKDVDAEIVEALEILKVNFDNVRIIILAANRYSGDELLTQCFQMAIYNLIVTDDYLAIKNELIQCLSTGKTYKEALKYKEKVSGQEQVVVKTEVKQVVSKVLIGLTSSGAGQGCTHNSIVLANYLRKKGYMVAIAEMNLSKAFSNIQEAYELQMFDDRYFSMEGIDYYPDTTSENLGSILGKTYNFILCDFGAYDMADRVSFGKCDIRIVVAGTKPWEMPAIDSVFQSTDQEALKSFYYCFNLVPKLQQVDVKAGMCELSNVYFLNYTEDPFKESDFNGAEEILKDYLPVVVVPEKKRGLFKKR